MEILKIDHLTKSFGKFEVLKGVSFSMKEGEVVSIIGASGSGKTTLLRCINFLERADGGAIYLDGNLFFDSTSEKSLSPVDLRKKQLNFGLVFQDFNLFPQYHVLDNVMLAPRHLAKERPDFKERRHEIYEEIRREAVAILDSVGLSDKQQSYPCELSGGQKQRVSIARALILKPRVLFFDEPTSALDPELTGEILKVIRNLASQHVTMVIITHEIDFAKNVSDKIIFMADGTVVEEGTPEEVIDHPKNERTRSFLQKLGEK